MVTRRRCDRGDSPRGRTLWALYRERPELVLVPAVFVAIVVIWEAAVKLLGLKVWILPPPSLIGRALWSGLVTARLYPHLLLTLEETLLGFAGGVVSGVVLGAAIAQFYFFEKGLFPYIVGFQAVPKVAIAPLIVIGMGFGIMPKALIAALSALFPVVVNTVHGLRSTQQEQLDLMRSLSASEWQIFRKVRVPNAMPFFFAGLEVAIVSSVIGVIVGEFVGSQAGLGYLILQYNFTFDIAGVYAVLIVLSAMGIALHWVVKLLHQRVVFWGAPAQH